MWGPQWDQREASHGKTERGREEKQEEEREREGEEREGHEKEKSSFLVSCCVLHVPSQNSMA